MKATRENRKGSGKPPSILQEYEFPGECSFEQLRPRDTNITNINMSNDYMPFPSGKHFNEKLSDDGYGTDSRSSATGSISSPLSSSLSSLSPSEESPKSGSTHLSTPRTQSYNQASSQISNMQSGPIRKAHNFHGNSRTNVHKNSSLPVKRQSAKVEEPENVSSLEDRLRALTIIEEDETGTSVTDRGSNPGSDTNKRGPDIRKNDSQSPASNPGNIRRGKITVENINFEKDSNYSSAPYGTLPATTESPYNSYHLSDRGLETNIARGGVGNVYYQKGLSEISSMSDEKNGEGLKGYKRFFEKDVDVPAQNIDKISLPKFSGSRVLGRDISRQTTICSPALSSNQGFDFRQNDESVISESQNQIVNKGFGQNSERWHSLNETHSMRSVPEPQSHDQSHVSGQMLGPMSQYKVFGHQESPFQEMLQPYLQQEQQQYRLQQQQSRQHQYESHRQARTEYNQNPNSPSVFSDQFKNMTSMDPAHSMFPDDAVNYLPSQSYPDALQKQSQDTISQPAPVHYNQGPWQPESPFDQHQLALYKRLNNMGLERSSFDLGNIPNLQRQIRASSEQSLQASRKLTYASSADIHKLFSGKKKPSVPLRQISDFSSLQSDQQSYCDSFSSSKTETPSPGPPLTVQDSFRSNPRLRVLIPSMPARGVSPNPIRADHAIHIPPEAWTNVTSLPNSASSEVDRMYFQKQNQPRSANADLDRPSFQRSLSANIDTGTDRSQFHGLSSGYSSESEMQQIESNAEAIKKLLKVQEQLDRAPNNLLQVFLPLNRSLDHDSNTDTDIEPASENEPSLAGTQTSDSVSQPLSSVWFSQKIPSLPQSLAPSAAHKLLAPHVVAAEGDPLIRSQNLVSTRSFSSNSDVNTHGSDTKNIVKTGYLNSVDAQNQDINFINNPNIVTAHANYVPEYNVNTNQSSNTNANNVLLLKHFGSQSSNISPASHSVQHNRYSDDLPVGISEDYHDSSGSYSPSGHFIHHGGQAHLQGSHHDYSKRDTRRDVTKFSPVEAVYMLEIPFETHIISDERGDRLSTLV